MGTGASKTLASTAGTLETKMAISRCALKENSNDITDSSSWIINQEIEKAIQKDLVKKEKTIKLLLLGGSESGKSTILKQMKILHAGGFDESEIMNFKFAIYKNIITIVKCILATATKLQLPLSRKTECEDDKVGWNCKHRKCNRQDRYILMHDIKLPDANLCASIDFEKILNTLIFDSHLCLNSEMTQMLIEIRDYPLIACILDRNVKSQLPDNTEYFLSQLEAMESNHFVPRNEDILQCRVVTTAVYEVCFEFKHENLVMIDVGGQKTERRKWIHCFDDVTAIVFVIALSSYDERVVEDSDENRLRDSIELFKDITENQFLSKASVILFLNKKDIFKRKIATIPLSRYFNTYKGDNTYNDGISFIKTRLLNVSKNRKNIFTHLTNATDTKNVDRVFRSVMEAVVIKNLDKAGMA